MYHFNKVAGQKFAEISIELQWKITVGPKQICKKESSFYHEHSGKYVQMYEL